MANYLEIMNKKFLLCCFFSLLVYTTVHAQKFHYSRIKYGFVAGVNGSVFTRSIEQFASRTGESDRGEYENHYRFSPMIGLTAEYRVSPNFMPSMELIYQGSGMSYRRGSGTTIISPSGASTAYSYFHYQIDFVKIPLLANYTRMSKSDGARWAFFGGVAPAFAIRSNVGITGWYNPDNTPVSERTSSGYPLEDVSAFNADLMIGMQRRGESGLVVGIRSNYTVLPVFDYSSNSRGNLDTRIISCSLNVGFQLK